MREAFQKLTEPDDDLLAVLLFWRDAKLTHVEALDDAHFADDAAKTKLFDQVVPRLVRERQPEVISLATHGRSYSPGSPTDKTEDVLVTVAGGTFVKMFRAKVERRSGLPPALGPWRPFPESADFEVKTWINDAIQSALIKARSARGLGPLFRDH